MEVGRKEYFKFSGGHQKVVPVGVWLDRIHIPRFEEINKHTLVFMGHITEKQGVQHILDAVPSIIEKIPDFNFLVIGGGNFFDSLKSQAARLNITDHVTFTGYVKEHKDIEEMISRSAVAVALYDKHDAKGNISFTYFSDPAKLKTYLACGLPVLVTDVPYNAEDIQAKGCGKIITSDVVSVTSAVIELMANESKLQEYRKNALDYAKRYNWSTIFADALEGVLGA